MNDKEKNLDYADKLLKAEQSLAPLFAAQMLELARSQGLVLREGLQNNFIEKATKFLQKEPFSGILRDRFLTAGAAYLYGDGSFSLGGTIGQSELAKAHDEIVKAYMMESGEAARLKTLIETAKRLVPSFLEIVNDLPSLFTRKMVLLGEEVDVLQCYIAWGVPPSLFRDKSNDLQRRNHSLEIAKTSNKLKEAGEKLLADLLASVSPEDREIIKNIKAPMQPYPMDSEALALLRVILAQTYDELKEEIPKPLAEKLEVWERKRGVVSIDYELFKATFWQSALSYLPSEAMAEITSSPEKRFAVQLLAPFSCAIGRMQPLRLGFWPCVSPKSVDSLHIATATAYALCDEVRQDLLARFGIALFDNPRQRQAERLLEGLFNASAAFQGKRRIAEERNLELSDKIETTLSDQTWLERIGGTVSPRPWQLTSTEIAANNPRIFLADPTGFGKTGQALLILERNVAFPAVIICPPAVFQNWAAEATQWLPRRSVSLIKDFSTYKIGNQTLDCDELWDMVRQGFELPPRVINRAYDAILVKNYVTGQFDEHKIPVDRYDAEIVIVSKDLVKGEVKKGKNSKALSRLLTRKNTGFVFDESHYLKNRRTDTYRGAKVIASQARTRLLLSATLLTNTAEELRNQLDVLGQLYDFFGSPAEFMQAFSSLQGGGLRGGATQGLNEQIIGQTQKVNEILRRCCYVRRFPEQLEQAGAMPRPERITYPAFLSHSWMQTYMQSIKEFELAIREYATTITGLLVKAIFSMKEPMLQAFGDRQKLLNKIKIQQESLIEIAQTTAKNQKKYKGKSDKEIADLCWVEAFDNEMAYFVGQLSIEALQSIETEANSATKILANRLAAANEDLALAIEASGELDDEEDEEDEEKRKKAAAKREKRKKAKEESKKQELSDSQRDLIRTCVSVFFDSAFWSLLVLQKRDKDAPPIFDAKKLRESLQAKGQLTPQIESELTRQELAYQGDIGSLIHSFAQQITEARLEGAVLNRINALSQITSAAKISAVVGYLLDNLAINTTPRLQYKNEAEKEAAIKKSQFKTFIGEDGGLYEVRPRKIVVFCLFKSTINRIIDEVQAAGFRCVRITGEESKEEKAAAQAAFSSNPEIRVCVCSIGAAREGLNLQVADLSVFIDQHYTAASMDQAEGRIKRLGSPYQFVTMAYFVAPDTIDTLKVSLIERKRDLMLGAQEGVRSIDRVFEKQEQEEKQTHPEYKIKYEFRVDGGRIEPMFLGAGTPDVFYGENVLDVDIPIQAEEMTQAEISWWMNIGNQIKEGQEEIAKATKDKETGATLAVLEQWRTLAKVQSAHVEARFAKKLSYDERKKRLKALGQDEDGESGTDTEDHLINSVLSKMDLETRYQLSEREIKEFEQILPMISEIASVRKKAGS